VCFKVQPLAKPFTSFVTITYSHLPELLWWLGGPAAWAFQAARLVMFVFLLLPGFIPQALRYWWLSPHVWSCSYGESVRQRLDVYVALGPDGQPVEGSGGAQAKVPIVLFVTGGAWIIGYRMWGFLMAFALQKRGVACVCIDYRNFPQARIPQMVDDVAEALDWVYAHAAQLGGSPYDISLVGQSAGAHLSAMVLLRLMRGSKTSASAARPPLRQFIGISGPYDMPKIKHSLSKRGLHPGLIDSLACGELAKASPSLLLPASGTRRRGPSAIIGDEGGSTGGSTGVSITGGSIGGSAEPAADDALTEESSHPSTWPPVVLFHGTADQTVPWEQSRDFAVRLRACGATRVVEKYYEDKSHTDPILEDPICGGDPLMADLLDLVLGPAERPAEQGLWPSFVPARHRIIQQAKWINPF